MNRKEGVEHERSQEVADTSSMRGSNLTLDRSTVGTLDRNQLSLGGLGPRHNGSLGGSICNSHLSLSIAGGPYSNECKTDQLRQRQAAHAAVAIIQRESHFNMRCLWVGWVFMSWVSGMMAAAGFLLPYWLKGSRQGDNIKQQLSDLGLFRLCAYPVQLKDEIKLVMDCGHYKNFVEIPSPLWQFAFILMATACCLLLLLTFFLAFSGFKLYILRIRSVIVICGMSQCVSAVFIGLCCLLYPAGWANNPDVEQVCGQNAGAFQLGHCQLGWAYVLSCAGGFLSGVTVGFPIQIARQFKEDWYAAEKTKSATERQPLHPHHHHQQQHAQSNGKYNYVVYHNLQHVHGSRPNSMCTCASDCNLHEFGTNGGACSDRDVPTAPV